MDRISKPHLVNFLRMSDKSHWLHPRIRYASIRSKPQLLQDLRKHFRTRLQPDPLGGGEGTLRFLPVRPLPCVPKIEYSFRERCFLFDGKPREKPDDDRVCAFRIVKGPVTLVFH